MNHNFRTCENCNKKVDQLWHDDNTGMAVCTACAMGDIDAPATMTTACSHADCYAKGLHAKSAAGRAACRKNR